MAPCEEYSTETGCSDEYLQQFETESNDTSVFKTTNTSDSCLFYFDQMSFCFSPANQFRYYYTYGITDTCDSQVDDFWRCIRSKLKGTSPPLSASQEKSQERVEKRQHLWTFRATPPAVFAFPESPNSTEWSIPKGETDKPTFI